MKRFLATAVASAFLGCPASSSQNEFNALETEEDELPRRLRITIRGRLNGEPAERSFEANNFFEAKPVLERFYANPPEGFVIEDLIVLDRSGDLLKEAERMAPQDPHITELPGTEETQMYQFSPKPVYEELK